MRTKIKAVLYDIIVHELKINNKDEINTLLKAITFKIDEYENIIECALSELNSKSTIKDIKATLYDIIYGWAFDAS